MYKIPSIRLAHLLIGFSKSDVGTSYGLIRLAYLIYSLGTSNDSCDVVRAHVCI